MTTHSPKKIGLDLGIFAIKGVLCVNGRVAKTCLIPNNGQPQIAAIKCLQELLQNNNEEFNLGLTGSNARLIADKIKIDPILEVEALAAGLNLAEEKADYILSLGHENMYYLELDQNNHITYFNRNGQCAAGSGAFWYQQATRLGYDDQGLAQVALEAETSVKISGRCAVFAKSDMTHAINEGATYSTVSAGLAQALVDLVLTSVARNRLQGPGTLMVTGGVANNKAVLKYLQRYCREKSIRVVVPQNHLFINAFGAARNSQAANIKNLSIESLTKDNYIPERPLPPLDPKKVTYSPEHKEDYTNLDFNTVYLGVDCGSVSTKCVLLDGKGKMIGGIYLPTAGRPALQVLELMKKVEKKYGRFINQAKIVTCTTGSGRFLSQKILNANYAADEITCQAEGVKALFPEEKDLAIIEIGGEDSKFMHIKDSILYDYNMNPVCAAGTGTFLENLAELLQVSIKEEFSRKAFSAPYAIDLGDICTLLSQSALAAAASRGLPLPNQLASLAYSSARNYLNKTVENRPLTGHLIFTGATAKNQALASALAAECEKEITVPPYPELSGALGAALMAKNLYARGEKSLFSFRRLQDLNTFQLGKQPCRADCEHEHNCTLDIITFADKSRFIYGDRCGRYSGIDKIRGSSELPNYAKRWEKAFWKTAGEVRELGTTEKKTQKPQVGIARGGLFYELFPFWAAFFRSLGAEVVISSETNEKILEQGKKELDSEMCYPLEVLMGHYRELAKSNVDYIFIPEVVNSNPHAWARKLPQSFSCPLMQTTDRIIANSLAIPPGKHLYSQLNYREGMATIARQLKPVAKKILKQDYNPRRLRNAVRDACRAQKDYRLQLEEEGRRALEEIAQHPNAIVAICLGRPYTLYDSFVSKGSLDYAQRRGLLAIPQDFLLEFLQGWYEGRQESSRLDNHSRELKKFFAHYFHHMDNIYPYQVQKMISAALLAKFLNENDTGLPSVHIILQDPFKCGPNAMLRHFLGNLTGYMRLTLDEHTAPAGMITRLEAFKNTCRSRKKITPPPFYSARTTSVNDKSWKKILIPHPSRHAHVFKAMFKNAGVDAELLPRSNDNDLTLARHHVNGEECLPFIQNVQDMLEYLENNIDIAQQRDVLMFQGWACGPCRYGLYASTQALVINKAGYGPGRICAVKLTDTLRRFGLKYAVGGFNGAVAMDLLYKMLHVTRPYEKTRGMAEKLFNRYADELIDWLESYSFKLPGIISGSYLKPLGDLLQQAGEDFSSLPLVERKYPRILLGGEFYVRLDDRNNENIIKKIEKAGGEVYMAPATEIFAYTAYFHSVEARRELARRLALPKYLEAKAYDFLSNLAHRDEMYLTKKTGKLLKGLEEPEPKEIMARSRNYVSDHYGGEPPMTIGRTACLADRERVAGAIFVAPFTCMPGSVVEAQQGFLQEELQIPIITLYYDGKESTNREEFIKSLVFQAQQLTDIKLK